MATESAKDLAIEEIGQNQSPEKKTKKIPERILRVKKTLSKLLAVTGKRTWTISVGTQPEYQVGK